MTRIFQLLVLTAPLAGAFSLSGAPLRFGRAVAPRAPAVALDASTDAQQKIITFSPSAMTHIQELRVKQGVDAIHLRMGVRAGGCSGMSYVMDFMDAADVGEMDTLIDYPGGVKCVIDPKSLMFLYGLKLDYSDVRAVPARSVCVCMLLFWPHPC